MDIRNLAGNVLKKALSEGVDGAEVFCVASTSSSVEAKGGQVDSLEGARERGLGLRIIRGDRIGFSYSSSVDDDAVARLVREASASAIESSPDPHYCLPAPSAEGYPVVVTADPALREIGEGQLADWAIALERAALERDSRVRAVRKASVGLGFGERCILSSTGIETVISSTLISASTMVMAEGDGDSQSGWEFDYSRTAGRLDVEKVGRAAADRALRLLGAGSIASCSVPVILENSVGADFLGVLASAFSAENVQKGKSLLAGKEGVAVASPLVNIVDDGLLPGGIASSPSDDEGVAMRATALVEEGVLKAYLHNSYTAKKAGATSTGNAVRGGFKSAPGVGVSNFYIKPGVSPIEELLDVDNGFFVTEAMGIHTANPVSGDFSIGVSGLWVEKGRCVRPVRGAVIAGNIITLMKDIDLIGNDLRFFGKVGSPSLRVRGLSISGK